MTFNLTPWLSSPMRLNQVTSELQEYLVWYSHAKVQRQVSGQTSIDAPKLSVQTLALLAEVQKEQPISGDAFDQILARLKHISDTAPTVTVTLAASPSEGLRQTVVKWMREQVDPNALVTFQINSALLGGLVIRLGSHMYDWSFRRQILDNREKFAEVLSRV